MLARDRSLWEGHRRQLAGDPWRLCQSPRRIQQTRQDYSRALAFEREVLRPVRVSAQARIIQKRPVAASKASQSPPRRDQWRALGSLATSCSSCTPMPRPTPIARMITPPSRTSARVEGVVAGRAVNCQDDVRTARHMR